MSALPDSGKRSLCVSDLHLQAANAPAFRALDALLRVAAEAGHNLFLLGDLCEVWIGDDDDDALATAFRGLLAELAEQTFVGLMHGNRDFLYGEALAAQTGATLLPDPFRFGPALLLSHGDAFCTDDEAYQKVRQTFRSEAWQRGILTQPLQARRALAASMRAESQKANANKAANIMDVSGRAVREALLAKGCHTLIHGHTHRPGRHALPMGMRVVLGDWHRVGWAALIEPPAAFGENAPTVRLGCQAVATLATDPGGLLAALGGPL